MGNDKKKFSTFQAHGANKGRQSSMFNLGIMEAPKTGRISASNPDIVRMAESISDVIKPPEGHFMPDFDIGGLEEKFGNIWKLEDDMQRRFAKAHFYNFTDKQIDIIKSEMPPSLASKADREACIDFFSKSSELFENNKEFYIDNEGCSSCKGRCCKKASCSFSPDDFKDVSYESLKLLIESGVASIDWYDKDEDTTLFFIRAREEGMPELYPSYGGTCSLLTDKGCKLDWSKRPKGGRLLRTTADSESCMTDYDKEQCADDWSRHSEVLLRLVEDYRDGRDLKQMVIDFAPPEIKEKISMGFMGMFGGLDIDE